MSFWNWVTGYDAANADAAAAADAKLRAMNAVDYAPGGSIYGTVAANQGQDAADALIAQVNADYAAQSPIGQAAQTAEINQAFKDKLDEQAKAIVGGPLSVIGDVLKSILKAFPWWVWLIIIIVPFGYLGGVGWLTRKAKTKFAK